MCAAFAQSEEAAVFLSRWPCRMARRKGQGLSNHRFLLDIDRSDHVASARFLIEQARLESQCGIPVCLPSDVPTTTRGAG